MNTSTLLCSRLRVDRLEQEIDGACFVARKIRPTRGEPAVTKMIGTRRVRSEPRISSASWKPSCPASDVDERERHFVLEQQLERRLAARRPAACACRALAAAPRAPRGSRHVVDGEHQVSARVPERCPA